MIGDLFKVVLGGFQNGQITNNVLYYVIDADSQTDSNQLFIETEFVTSVLPTWVLAVSDKFLFECIQTQMVFPGEVQAVRRSELGNVGSIAGDLLPATAPMLIRKTNPAVGGIGKKGRLYMSGLVEAGQNNGQLTESQFNLLGNVADVLREDLTNVGDGVAAPAWAVRNPVEPFEITGFIRATVWDPLPRTATQRRRRTPNRDTIAP